ncbi:MAG: hypothetical protein F4029_19165 [Gammaproteobacteria bacterium]|nr:hypothetical protein [Gammaproteobacteria bacterium]MYK48335.1 hypothetical protein [Gammaproteobacteria bacterium]
MKHINTEKELEEVGSAAVRDLLRCLPGAKVTPLAGVSQAGGHRQADGLVRVKYGDTAHLLVIEVKAHGAPRFVRSAVHQLESIVAHMPEHLPPRGAEQFVPILVAPYLSPESQAICRDYDVAYVDLEGNARLVFDGVYIERSVPSKPKPETRALRSIFTPKAAAILRALLREPEGPWLVTDLAGSANASLGHVSNVCKALLEREWVDRRPDGIVLTQPNALLRTWRENYRQPRAERFDAYTHLHGRKFEDLARTALNAETGVPRVMYARASAAQWIAPFSRDATQSFYADEAGARILREKLSLRPVGMGSNVVLYVTTDESLFDDAIEPVPGLFCTDPITTYLDLWCGNDREREAAEHLGKEALPWIE